MVRRGQLWSSLSVVASLSEALPGTDPRIRRSRAALLEAAVAVVEERQCADVSVTEVARRADVSRKVVYERFGSGRELIATAAVHLIQTELLPRLSDDPESAESVLLAARHLSDHRDFYKAALEGGAAIDVQSAVIELFRPLSRDAARRAFAHLDDGTAAETAEFLTGATVMAITHWVVETPAGLDPDAFAGKLLRLMDALTEPRTASGRGAGGAR